MDTSIPSIKIMAPEFTPEESRGLQDYWGVYEVHRHEIATELVREAVQFPAFKFILQNSSLQPSPEQQEANIQRQRRAIYQNDWEPYLKSLWEQGKTYAQAGLSFHAWFEMSSLFRKLVRPYLLDSSNLSKIRKKRFKRQSNVSGPMYVFAACSNQRQMQLLS